MLKKIIRCFIGLLWYWR